MKFKNFYILLIVMILLVVGTGFVCASEDTALALTNNQTEVIYTDSGDVFQEKINTNAIPNEEGLFNENPIKSIDVENSKYSRADFDGDNLAITDETANVVGDFVLEDKNLTSVKVNSTGKIELKLNLTNQTSGDISSDDLNITLNYSNSTKEINTFKIENDILIVNVSDVDFKSARLLIKYNNTLKANLTLNRIYNVRLDVINNEAEFQSGNFTYKVVDIDAESIPIINKTLTLKFGIKNGTSTYGDSLSALTDDDGVVVFKNSDIFVSYFNLVLGLGVNSVSIEGDSLNIENPTQNVTITQAPINITVDPYSEYYNSGKNIKIHVVNAKTGEAMKFVKLHVYMPTSIVKNFDLVTSNLGIGEIRVSNYGVGTHPITVNNLDTLNMTNVTASGSMIIKKTPVTINAKDVTIYYNSGTTATFSVTKNGVGVSGVDVYVKIYSINYHFITDKNGKISLSKVLKPPISKTTLNVGSHKMTIFLADSSYEAKSVVKTIKVKKANAKITSAKINIYYKQSKSMSIKLTNTKTKKAIYNVKLNIKLHISKKRYYDLTGVTDKNGKITFPLNVEPNAKGILTLKRDLKPGTYKVEITGKNNKNIKIKKITTKITVKKAPVKFIIKKSSKKYIMLTVKNKKTKDVVSGMKVKVKVKSKIYTVKTNLKGIAKIGKVFKAGKYKVSVSSANKYCVGKTTNALVKIKK